MVVFAGIDIGKSGTRAVFSAGKERSFSAISRGVSPSNGGDLGRAAAQLILLLLADLEAPRELSRLVVGATCDFEASELEMLRLQLQKEYPMCSILVSDDGTLAHAALVQGSGTLLSLGTGTIAIAMNESGEVSRFDGWGPLFGDRGSAFGVGLAGFRSALLLVDKKKSSPLTDAASAAMGELTSTSARRIMARDDWAATVAAFAPMVVDLAAQGDKVCKEILADQMSQAAETACIAVGHAGTPSVVVSGRFAQLPLVRSLLERQILSFGANPSFAGDVLMNLDFEVVGSRRYANSFQCITDARPISSQR